MEKVRYEEMLPHEIVARRRKCPAAFIGLGTLEWHGEHLAVGNDALKADKLCELAAQQSGGFAFPALWYGEPRSTALAETEIDPDGAVKRFMKLKKRKFTDKHVQKSAEAQMRFYEDLVFHVLLQMNALEMKAVCLVCGHYPLKLWATKAVARFNDQFTDTQAFAGTETAYPRRGEDVGGDHAGKWETSYLWYLRPDCVDMSVFLGRKDEELIGVRGFDPRTHATIEVGRRACNLIADGMARKAKQLIAKVKRRRAKR